MIAQAAEDKVREHLYQKDAKPNKMGAPKTHYYRQAGDSSSGQVKGLIPLKDPLQREFHAEMCCMER